MDSLSTQLYAFAITVLSGVTLAFLFDLYRVIRGFLRPGAISTAIMDLGFWLVGGPVVILYLLLANWGELRLYVMIGLALGILFYLVFLHAFIVALLIWTGGLIIRLACGVGSLVFLVVAVPINVIQDLVLGLTAIRRSGGPRLRFTPGLRWRGSLVTRRR